MEDGVVDDEIRPCNDSRIDGQCKWNLDGVFALGICQKSDNQTIV